MGPGDPVGGGAHGADEVFVVKFVVSLFFRKIKFHQIKRLDRSNTRFDCTNTTGALDFEVDRKVWLHDIGLFGEAGSSNALYVVKIKVFVKEELKLDMDQEYIVRERTSVKSRCPL